MRDVKPSLFVIYCRKSSEAEDKQVSSISDQLRELESVIRKDNLQVVKTFSEARSAKAPGRQEFSAMLDLIDKGGIRGIICWKLNRLSRNPIDSGKLQWLLQSGKIESIVTPTKTYTEEDSDFIMAVEGAQANRFIRDLRDDTMRGVKTKLEMGWKPGLAPTGYQNNKFELQGKKTISPHPTFFTLTRKIFDLALTGNFSLEQLVAEAAKLDLKTNHGKTISKSQMHRLLRDKFYTGRFDYSGQEYQGAHKPMITEAEHQLMFNILSGRGHSRKRVHNHALSGLIRHTCGRMVVGDTKIKHYKNGSSQTFIYYRCSRSHKCNGKYVKAEDLECQINLFLRQVEVSHQFVEWAGEWLLQLHKRENSVQDQTKKLLQTQLKEVEEKILGLVENRLTDSSFSAEDVEAVYQRLKIRKISLEESLAKASQQFDDVNEIVLKTFEFAEKARERFEHGTPDEKKLILRAIGSNLVLKGQKLFFEAKTPFVEIKKLKEALEKEGVVRTKKRSELSGKCEKAFDKFAPWGHAWDVIHTYYVENPVERTAVEGELKYLFV